MGGYLCCFASVTLVLAEDVSSFPFSASCSEGHCKSQAVAIPVIPAVLDCSVAVDWSLLTSLTVSVISAVGK